MMRLQPNSLLWASLFLLDLGVLTRSQTSAAGDFPPYRMGDLQPCSLSSYELSQLRQGPDDSIEPCILYDEVGGAASPDTVTMVQVTPSSCRDHRDGALTGIRSLNAENGGRGISIGYHENYTVNFRFLSIVAGNDAALGAAEYDARHAALLRSALMTEKPQYIIGTCSFKAALERELALEHKTILMAQVGPPGYYRTGNNSTNPYVFGFHINSDLYPYPALQALNLYVKTQAFPQEEQPIVVVYRNRSEFFASTCRAAIAYARELGFTDITAVEFDPDATGDDDDDDDEGNATTTTTTVNALNKRFLNRVADQSCPPPPPRRPAATGDDGQQQQQQPPALFACTLVEQDQLLKRWRRNGCRPSLVWMTASEWAWAGANPTAIPYFQGGGQWHESFDYADRYFDSGRELIAFNEARFGYRGTYDTVASYSIAVLLAQHVQSTYRIADEPTVGEDFQSAGRYEAMRRDLLRLAADTLFGPFSLDRDQRNAGRTASGSQWLPAGAASAAAAFESVCVSPLAQAEAAAAVPSDAARNCGAGRFLSLERIRREDAILLEKCEACPASAYSPRENGQWSCARCPVGSSTGGEEGATACVIQDSRLVAKSAAVMGFTFVGVTWYLSMLLILFHTKNRKNRAVQDFPLSFLTIMCLGAIISSSSIIALVLAEADDGQDTTGATNACRAIPFLYTIGWLMQYGCLAAKAYKQYCESRSLGFIRVDAREMHLMLLCALLLDLIVVVAWTSARPLEYLRSSLGARVDQDEHLIHVVSRGECTINGPTSVWAFVVPLLLLHVGLMIVTNVMLRRCRPDKDIYHARRYVAITSVCIGEVLLIGIPMFLAVGDNSTSRFIVLSIIVFLSDMSFLLITCMPTALHIYNAEDDEVALEVGSTESSPVDGTSTTREKVHADTVATSQNAQSANPNSPEEGGELYREYQTTISDKECIESALHGSMPTDASTPPARESP